MTTRVASVGAYAPRLLRREGAAAYLAVSPSKFDELVKAGSVPPPKQLPGIKAWDRADLDALADGLPYVEPPAKPDTTWD